MNVFERQAGLPNILAVLFGSVLVWGLSSAGTLYAQTPVMIDPISDIALEMNVVVAKLAKRATGKPTQTKQEEVIAKLDALIEMLEKECEKCKSGGASGAFPTKPLNDSVLMGGPGGIGDLHAARKRGKKWGELPPHERDRIVQSLTDGFPVHYQIILERYYRRLANEEPVANSADDLKEQNKDIAEPKRTAEPLKDAGAAATTSSEPSK